MVAITNTTSLTFLKEAIDSTLTEAETRLEAFSDDHALKEELDYQASRSSAPAPDAGRPITILADRELPYELLKKIMSTCVDAGYASISLAVNQKTEQGA